VGMTLFLFGLFKKYIADSAALYADDVYMALSNTPLYAL